MKRTRNYYGKSHQKFMEVILLWNKKKAFFGLSIIRNIITEKWGNMGMTRLIFLGPFYYIVSRIGYTVMIYTVRAHFYVHVWKPYKSIRLVILTIQYARM